jgi:hypothetical protein
MLAALQFCTKPVSVLICHLTEYAIANQFKVFCLTNVALESQATFQRIVSHPSSGLTCKSNKRQTWSRQQDTPTDFQRNTRRHIPNDKKLLTIVWEPLFLSFFLFCFYFLLFCLISLKLDKFITADVHVEYDKLSLSLFLLVGCVCHFHHLSHRRAFFT